MQPTPPNNGHAFDESPRYDEYVVAALAEAAIAQMQAEGTARSPLTIFSESLRIACFLQTHEPLFLRKVADWYADSESRSHDELAQAARGWVDNALRRAREFRLIA